MILTEINFNHNILFLNDIKCGRTIYIAKIGYKKFVLDINKNISYSFIDIYPIKKDKCNNLIKYDNKYLKWCCLKNSVIIDKDFLINEWEKIVFIYDNKDLLKFISC